MITIKEAFKIAQTYIHQNHKDCDILEEWVIDDDDVFVTRMASKKYIETRNHLDHLVGAGPIIIDKEDGYLIMYGSAYSTERAVKDYRTKKPKWNLIRVDFPSFDIQTNYNIKIEKKLHEEKLIDLLFRSLYGYIVAEVEGDTIWRVRHSYTKEVIKERLATLPTIFTDLPPDSILNFYEKTKAEKIATYTLEEYIDVRKEWNVNRATKADYETKW